MCLADRLVSHGLDIVGDFAHGDGEGPRLRLLLSDPDHDRLVRFLDGERARVRRFP